MHFERHFLTRHTGIQPFELYGGEDPKEPFCKNWKAVLHQNEKPIYIKRRWKKAFDQLVEDVKRDPKKAQSVYVGNLDEYSQGEDIDEGAPEPGHK